MEKTTIKKNSEAKIVTKSGKDYSYKYTELADINDYLESINARYYQYVEVNELNSKDYIMTVPIIDGVEQKPRRGVQIVEANLLGNDNPAQKQGSATTYARRYSLLMAFGLATEDDDAQGLSKSKEEIKKQTITSLATKKQIDKIESLLNEAQIKQACEVVKKSSLEEFTIQEASSLISNLTEKENK